jgi:4-hydroxy-2-oxoheptanedioate aldolase
VSAVRRAASLRARLAQGRPLLATFSVAVAPEIVELIAVAGFDAVVIDMEHGPHTISTVRAAVTAAQMRDIFAIVRTPDRSGTTIGAVLDAGADGILVPQVASVADAAAVVDAARYAPEGHRGVNPWTRGGDYDGGVAGFAAANEQIAVIVSIESGESAAQADAFAAVPGVDCIFFGPYDLAQSLGVGGRPGDERVVGTIVDASRRASAHVATAVFASTPEGAIDWFERGMPVVICGVDTGLVLGGFRDIAARARPA